MGKLARAVTAGALFTTVAACESLTTVEEKYSADEIRAHVASLTPAGVIDYAFANGTNSAGDENTGRHNLNNTNTCLHRTPFDPTRQNQPDGVVELADGVYVVTNSAGHSGHYRDANGDQFIPELRLNDNGPETPPTPADAATAAYMEHQRCNFDPYRE